MSIKHQRRFGFLLFVLMMVAVIVGLVLFALKQNINLFFTPKQIAQEAPLDTEIRVGGMVEKGSLKRGESLKVEFVITDFEKTLPITYTGILPDLFREGQGVVARGRLNSQGVFMATEILAKHDENYMPPELRSIKKGQA